MKLSDRILICGLPRTGKTTLARHLASFAKSNLMIIDPLNQYSDFDTIIPKGNRIVPEPGKEMETFESVCRSLCRVSCHLLMLEECEDYLGQGQMLPLYAYKVIRQGRNWGIGVVAITQRLSEVSKRFFDRCQHIFFFRCGVYSQDYIKDRIGKEKAAMIFQLSIEGHEFAHYDVGEDTIKNYVLEIMGAVEYIKPAEKGVKEPEAATLKLKGIRPHIEEGEGKGEMPKESESVR